LSDYLLLCFKSFYHRGIFAKVGGGVGINHLSAEKFSRVVVPLAPTPEQVRIVADIERRLSMADESEAQVEAGLRRAEGLRRAILKRAFEGNLG
jgi:type I restriction enzyme S subunit